MNRATAITIAALLAALPSAAMADENFHCSNGTVVTYLEETREMVVRGATGNFDVALPFAAAAGRYATWSPRGFAAAGERVAPFVEQWAQANGPTVVTYGLVPGEEVQCYAR